MSDIPNSVQHNMFKINNIRKNINRLYNILDNTYPTGSHDL